MINDVRKKKGEDIKGFPPCFHDEKEERFGRAERRKGGGRGPPPRNYVPGKKGGKKTQLVLRG